jgi:hypothetical protein
MILKSLIALFVDDEFLALAIVLVVAAASGLVLLTKVPPLAGGAVLLLGCLAALAIGVGRTVRRNPPK